MRGRKIVEDSDDEEQEVTVAPGLLAEPEAPQTSECNSSPIVDLPRSPASKAMNDSGQPSTGSTGMYVLDPGFVYMGAGLIQSKSV